MLKVRQWSDYGRSKLRRPGQNEDAKYANAKKGVFIIADGIGGGRNGRLAVELAVTKLRLGLESLAFYLKNGSFTEEKTKIYMQSYFQEANNLLSGLDVGGTTADACVIHNNTAYIGHIGDSRVYHYNRSSGLELLTKDDNTSNFDGANQDTRTKIFDRDNYLKKYLGMTLEDDEELEFSILNKELQKGDVLLMATDGLTDVVSFNEIASALKRFNAFPNVARYLVSKANNPKKMARSYAKHKGVSFADALEALGGRDNITAIAIKHLGGNYHG